MIRTVEFAERSAGVARADEVVSVAAAGAAANAALAAHFTSAAKAVAGAAARAADAVYPRGADNAAASAVARASDAAKLRNFAIEPPFRADFDRLASLAEWQKWTDDTPVPPEVFGPLWPEGPPKGWPPITDVPPRTDLALEAFARDRATEQIIEDDIVNLFNALNRYHIARSGVRLTLEQFQSLLPALVAAEV